MKIFINPGHHPGIDPGAVNDKYGVTEAEIVLAVGKKVEQLLTNAGHQVKLLQSNNLDGEDPSNVNVCQTANNWNANLFVSIHCNSYRDSTATGTETYIYNVWSKCADIADCIQDSIVSILGTADRGVKTDPYLCVLKNTVMPSVLVETAFISNEEDVQLLMHRQDDFAIAIANGILKALGEKK